MNALRFALASAIIILATGLFFGAALAETGLASWYGYESGSRRADGKRFNPDDVLCAHRRLPFGTVVLVTDIKTRRSVRCAIRDRGPAKWTGRIIDLSRGAARRLGIVKRGVARVKVEVVR